jgi:biopolymer transport protein ExbD
LSVAKIVPFELSSPAMSRSIVIAGLFVAACGAREAEVAADTTPIVGAMELPISLSNQAAAPTSAVRIEISPTELRVDGTKVDDLVNGRLSTTAYANNVITHMRTAIRPGQARASIRMHSVVAYQTLVLVLSTLEQAGMHEVSFQVRRDGATPTEAWMRLPRFRVAPPTGDVTYTTAPLPWSTFVEKWGEVYDACRAGHYVDCDNTAINPATGGNLQLKLWTRGQGMIVTFERYGEAAPEEQPAAPAGPELIEGIRAAPRAQPEVELGPPATEGTFTVYMQEATQSPSSISNLVRPVCGQHNCQAVIECDSRTPSMRVISLIGAAFSNGSAEPELVFRLPEPE